ncbi:MAG: rhodanese-like domain-containing protein [Hyphomicrobiales bacterium]|nr:rhodanese-like domain-containing protein [Hyphomicrobiales bacterium]
MAFGLAMLLLVFSTTVVFAGDPALTAPQIHQELDKKEMILMDIRTPQEWAQTGLAKGAWPVSMHEKDFGQRLHEILKVYEPHEIALICATGRRSTYLTQFLRKKGISGISNVSEGMFGNGQDPGWIARGLPVVTLVAAQERYKTFLREKPAK